MANETKQTAPTSPVTPPANRYLGDATTPGMFGRITFRPASAQAKVQGKEEPGADLSRKIANVTIEYLINGKPSGTFALGSVKAVQAKTVGAQAVPVFDWLWAQGSGRAIQTDDYAAGSEMEAYKIHVADQCADWMERVGTVAAPTAQPTRILKGFSLV